MQLQLSESDRAEIAEYRKKRVLRSVDPHKVNEQHGAIIVTCSDGDQFHDVFSHHQDVCKTHRSDTRIHAFALNGGAKLIAKSSPLRVDGEDKILLSHIGAARKLKNINTVVLYAHAPCGVAYTKDLSFSEVLRLLFEGKQRVMTEYPGIDVACFCHIDYGRGKKRTYFVSRDAWVECCRGSK